MDKVDSVSGLLVRVTIAGVEVEVAGAGTTGLVAGELGALTLIGVS